jgi:hypothetical protein
VAGWRLVDHAEVDDLEAAGGLPVVRTTAVTADHLVLLPPTGSLHAGRL